MDNPETLAILGTQDTRGRQAKQQQQQKQKPPQKTPQKLKKTTQHRKLRR